MEGNLGKGVQMVSLPSTNPSTSNRTAGETMAASQQQMLMQVRRARVATAFACVRCCICADSPLAAAQLLQQSAQQSQRPQVEFKCGKMKKNEGETRVAPDLRKGKLTVRADQDQLMHFIWTNREQGASRVRGVRSVARALPVWAAR